MLSKLVCSFGALVFLSLLPAIALGQQRARLVGINGAARADAQGAWIYLTVDSGGGAQVVTFIASPPIPDWPTTTPLTDPQIELWDQSGTRIGFNDDRPAELVSSASIWTQAPKAAVIRLSLAPGTYVARITGVGGTTGDCYLEVNSDAASLSSLSIRGRNPGPPGLSFVPFFGGLGNIDLRVFVTGPSLPATNPMSDPKLSIASSSLNSGSFRFIVIEQGLTTAATLTADRYRSPVLENPNNVSSGLQWTTTVDATLSPIFFLEEEGGGTNGIFLLEVHNKRHHLPATRDCLPATGVHHGRRGRHAHAPSSHRRHRFRGRLAA